MEAVLDDESVAAGAVVAVSLPPSLDVALGVTGVAVEEGVVVDDNGNDGNELLLCISLRRILNVV
jgi:hypothetical protein